ncbi:hypothetical protein MPTK1_1g27140 [Marchantia polymorpha subsp. ruderalis]|nr:hypothetical protein Mp_1g27140 [Marchantia polymorpha subsp. ruderalis]
MAGVRSHDQKGRLVPYTPSNGGASVNGRTLNTGNDGAGNNPYTAYDGKKATGLATHDGAGTGTGNFHGPSAPAGDYRPGSGHFGGATRAADVGTARHQEPAPAPAPARGYPAIDHHGGGGGGGAYVAGPVPVPVSSWHGSAPAGAQQNGGFTTNGPAGALENGAGGKAFGGGGAGGYGPAVPYGYGGQNESVSGSEKHHHHYYHYNNNNHHHPVPYNNNSVLPEEQKRRRRGAGALAAALIACWACTCCCHVPCGC